MAFEFQASRTYLILLVFLVSGTVIVLMVTPLAILPRLIMLLMIGFIAILALAEQGFLRSKVTIARVIYQENGFWLLQTSAKTYQASLCGDSIVTHVVLVLKFRIVGKFFGKTCILFKDSLPNKNFRRLLVLLKTQCS